MLTSFFSDIASGLTTFVPAFFKAILDAFTNLFLVTGEAGAVTGLTPVAEIAIGFLVIGMVYKILPTIIGWFKLRMSKRKARRRK